MGFWGKGNNPFFNHDFDAAQRDREAHRAKDTALKERLAYELDLQTQRSSAAGDLSRLRIQKNAMEAQYQEKIKEHESKMAEMRKAFYCMVIRSCIFEKNINDFIEKHPELSEELLDNLQEAREHCSAVEYRNKWWKWINEVEINYDMEYLNFPFQKRESKK
ncbi:TPA: hypothetical protein R4057_004122 [Kluyvera ascorbata]|uniref:hypothetical protein n=1 Tax=Kluyvera ascorbata TaxID=51288 RepID=UPI0028A099A9|nr:hypothetical protein [Kluyvera ascorbata]MEB6389880.1 hypothetical protein [Kluyvera ascorbata]HED3067095.1 hypothetical protein [Kluyvera ascorbata]